MAISKDCSDVQIPRRAICRATRRKQESIIDVASIPRDDTSPSLIPTRPFHGGCERKRGGEDKKGRSTKKSRRRASTPAMKLVCAVDRDARPNNPRSSVQPRQTTLEINPLAIVGPLARPICVGVRLNKQELAHERPAGGSVTLRGGAQRVDATCRFPSRLAAGVD